MTDDERRLCAGDWVRLVGSDVSMKGLGKVVDADYDPEDGALRLAQIEFAKGVHWFWSGDIRRIKAEEELRLTEAALEVAQMPEPARDRIKAALIDPPRPMTARSLGLLDLLWSLLSSIPNEKAVNGLARFFDDPFTRPHPIASSVPPFTPSEDRSARPPRLAALARGDRNSPPPAPRPAAPRSDDYDPIASEVTRPAGYVSAWRAPDVVAPVPPGGDAAIAAILGTLNHTVLKALGETCGVTIEAGASIAVVREQIGRAIRPTSLLEGLTDRQLALAGRALGFGPKARDIQRAELLQAMAPRTATDLKRIAALSGSEARMLLSLVGLEVLRSIALELFVIPGDDREEKLAARILEDMGVPDAAALTDPDVRGIVLRTLDPGALLALRDHLGGPGESAPLPHILDGLAPEQLAKAAKALGISATIPGLKQAILVEETSREVQRRIDRTAVVLAEDSSRELRRRIEKIGALRLRREAWQEEPAKDIVGEIVGRLDRETLVEIAGKAGLAWSDALPVTQLRTKIAATVSAGVLVDALTDEEVLAIAPALGFSPLVPGLRGLVKEHVSAFVGSGSRPTRFIGSDAIVYGILEWLDPATLLSMATAGGVHATPDMPPAQLRETIRLNVPLRTILAGLTTDQVFGLAAVFGIEPARDRETLTLAIRERAAPRTPGELERQLAISPYETRQLLALLPGTDLARLGAALGVVPADAATLVDRILAAAWTTVRDTTGGRAAMRILDSLPLETLELLAPRLDVAVIRDEPLAFFRARLAEACRDEAFLVHALSPEDLERVGRGLDVPPNVERILQAARAEAPSSRALERIVRTLPSSVVYDIALRFEPSLSPTASLSAHQDAILGRCPPADSIVQLLSVKHLQALARGLGLDSTTNDPDSLIASILERART